ncbi:hypothetical protein BJ912DRAFT_632852 [Pholiota molesta]|nr:hypothetical protein BJ912DRAFT_632852 [Pholiota molesta]
MIVDGVVTDAAWSIFFRFYLDEASHNIPMAQCRKLTQTSSDMKTWSDARYGGFLRFCTDCSLAEIRRHWALYAKSQDLSKNSRKAIRASFQSGMQSVRELHARNIITTVRAAGPLFLSVHGKGLGSYTSFWTMGVTTSKTSQGISTPYTNPTFAYPFSGKKFDVHYGLEPNSCIFSRPSFSAGEECQAADVNHYRGSRGIRSTTIFCLVRSVQDAHITRTDGARHPTSLRWRISRLLPGPARLRGTEDDGG